MKTIYTIQRNAFNTASALLKQSILFCVFLVLSCTAFSQMENSGAIKVILTDSATNDAIPFANVVVYDRKQKQVAVGTTNIDGECLIKVKPGIYSVKGIYVGYQAKMMRSVRVGEGKTAYITLKLSSAAGVNLAEVDIVTYAIPLIDPDTKSGQTITREEYQNLATKDINSVSATVAGVYARDDGQRKNTRGGRAEPDGQHNYYVTANTEQYESSAENKFKKCKKDPLSTFSSDVDVASYANIRRFINQRQLPPKEAVRIEEMVNYFRYQYPPPVEGEAFSIHSEISSCPWNKNNRLLQIGIQARAVDLEHAKANHLTFLIDVSGSMQSADKLPLLQDALKMLVKQLREEDEVAMVVYAGNAGLVLPSTNGKHQTEILQAIDQLVAGGSTAGGQGIQLAYEIAKKNYSARANNRVILATDGDFNVGISDDESLVKLIEEKRDEGIFLTVLGLGSGNYKDAKMEKLADKGNGNYAYLDNLLEAKKVLVKEIGGTLITLAKDVKIQIEFNPTYVKSYRLIGYDNRMLAHEDFKDDKKDAGDVGSGHSVTALYEIVPANDIKEVEPVDSLKYQSLQNTSKAKSNEICTIKLRYKEPEGKISQEISTVVLDQHLRFENTSANFMFCAAVVEFGLLLRQSEFKGEANYQEIIRLAKLGKGDDEEGYRAEFIRLCELSEMLANK
jgi:Ca-activated chloride channel family protein